MLLVRLGPTSHLPLHDDYDYRQTERQTDTTEIPPTELLGRIYITEVEGATRKDRP